MIIYKKLLNLHSKVDFVVWKWKFFFFSSSQLANFIIMRRAQVSEWVSERASEGKEKEKEKVALIISPEWTYTTAYG